MNVYEVGYLVTPSVPEEKVSDETDALRAMIERNGGAVISEEAPQLMDLAYTMYQSLEASKLPFKQGYFGSIKFDMPVASAPVLEKEIAASKNILRFVLVKTLRGNTIFTPKVAPKEEGADGSSPESKEGQADMDKSIDALVIS